ncbi:MAG: type II toxin-antitoxin system VapC family toxin [Candidatus Kapabacteria bacterium]|nr:type II toxin-antitoxin system VapC family toxin [Candidatus Kapabacteria bacterium]
MMYLLDSNIIIYHLNNIPQATEFISKNFNESSISIITYYEVLAYGYNSDDRIKVENFLNIFHIYEIDISIVKKALNNLISKKIKIADNLISATAQINNLILVTRNVADYSKLEIEMLDIFDSTQK